MKVTKDSITLENTEDRQVLWDALLYYSTWCYELSKSNHFAHDGFRRIVDRVQEDIMIPMHDTWDDIVH